MNHDHASEIESILKEVAFRLEDFGKERSRLIPILQMIQERHAYLPGEAIRLVAEHLDIAPCEVYGVATFYNQFRFHPPGKHPIKVCLGTACHVGGGDIILENFERKLGIREGETTLDREFSIERVACVGCCALAPVTVVGDQVHGHMAPSKVEGLILGFEIEKQKQERRKEEHDSGTS
jgi:NADH-quinone oxidoreductase subunit E